MYFLRNFAMKVIHKFFVIAAICEICYGQWPPVNYPPVWNPNNPAVGSPQSGLSPTWVNPYGQQNRNPYAQQNHNPYGQQQNPYGLQNQNSNGQPNGITGNSGSNINRNNQWPQPNNPRNGNNLDPYKNIASNQNSRFFGSSGSVNQLFGEPSTPSDDSGTSHCGLETYKKNVFDCLHKNASSLLEPDMSFPVKQEQVKKSCSMWATFFTCIRQKIQKCSNRKQFTTGLQEPINSLQKICHDENYQQKYLMQAQCMKNVVETYCSNPYNNLILRIKTEDTVILNYCCDGLVLKQCAMAPLKQQCSSLAEEILVSMLHFLSKCGQYRPQVPCPAVKAVPNSLPDPRQSSVNDLRDNTLKQDSRIGNGRLVDPTTRKPPIWRPNPTSYWPANPQPSQRKSSKSASSNNNVGQLHTLFFALIGLKFVSLI